MLEQFTIDNWNVVEGGLDFIDGDYNAEDGAPILKFRYEEDGKTFYCLTQYINGEDSVPGMVEEYEKKYDVSLDWVVIPSIFEAISQYGWCACGNNFDPGDVEEDFDGDPGFFVEEEGYYPGMHDRD